MRRNKYGAVRTTVEGVTFDSKAEADYYLTLRLLERAGQVRDIELQPSFVLRVNDMIIGTYRGDFRYCAASKRYEDVRPMELRMSEDHLRVCTNMEKKRGPRRAER